MTKPTFKSFIDHNPNVGVEAMNIRGLPGTGKSVTATNLGSWTLERGGIVVMRGSKSCEWRHFYNVKACKKITIFVPKELKQTQDKREEQGANIVYKRFPKEVFKDIKYVDYETLNLEKYIKPKEVFVIYDHCFNVAQRCWIIVDQLTLLANRSENNIDEIPITYIEHEAQVVFPMTPLSPKKGGISNKHWHAVNSMQHISVDFRKDLIRPIYVAQLSSQFNDLLRDLCCFKVYKKGKAGRDAPKNIQKSTPFLPLDKCNICVGEGLYLQNVHVNKFPEVESKWKMIPRKFLEYKCFEERLREEEDSDEDTWRNKRNKIIVKMYEHGMTQRLIGDLIGLSHPRISEIVNGDN